MKIEVNKYHPHCCVKLLSQCLTFSKNIFTHAILASLVFSNHIYCNESMMNAKQTDRATTVLNSINQQTSDLMNPQLKDYKTKAMAESSFTFYRATAYLYFEDFSSGFLGTPKHWKSDQYTSWIQGDFHLQNAGFFGSKVDLIYHLNDFDESYRGYFYLDLLRLMTSVYLLGDNVEEKMSLNKVEKITKSFVEHYYKTIMKGDKKLPKLPKLLSKLKKKLFKKKDHTTLLDKWTIDTDGRRHFDLSLLKLDAVPSTKKEAILDLLKINYEVKDIAIRLFSGLGSLGVEKYYFLVEGATKSNDDDLLYELKEQVVSNVVQTEKEKSAYRSEFSIHAKRAQVATHALLPNHNHYDYIFNSEISYGIKEISPYKKGVETFKNADDLKDYVDYLGTILAQSHIRSTQEDKTLNKDDFKMSVVNFFENKQNISDLVNVAAKYAKQVNDDYLIFKHDVIYNK